MEASPFLPEDEPQPPEVVVLVEYPEGCAPIYHFSVKGVLIEDIGATRQQLDKNYFTYNFFHNYEPFGTADVVVTDAAALIEWLSQDGDNPTPEHVALLPKYLEASVFADFGLESIREP